MILLENNFFPLYSNILFLRVIWCIKFGWTDLRTINNCLFVCMQTAFVWGSIKSWLENSAIKLKRECKFKQILECLVVVHIKMYNILPFDIAIPLLEFYPAGICTNILFPSWFLVENNSKHYKWLPVWNWLNELWSEHRVGYDATKNSKTTLYMWYGKMTKIYFKADANLVTVVIYLERGVEEECERLVLSVDIYFMFELFIFQCYPLPSSFSFHYTILPFENAL